MISFPCPGCGKTLRVKEEFAGKRRKCPQCGQSVAIPLATSVPAQPVGAAKSEAGVVLSALPSEVATIPPPSAAIPRAPSDSETISPQAADSVHAPTPQVASSAPAAPAHPFTFLA